MTVEPTEVLPARTARVPLPQPKPAPAQHARGARAVRADGVRYALHDQRQYHVHYHSDGDTGPSYVHRPATVASRATVRATAVPFALAAALSAVLSIPLWPSGWVAVPLLGLLLSVALAVRIATSTPINPTTGARDA